MVNTYSKALISWPLIAIMIISLANVNVKYRPEVTSGDGRIVNGDLIKEILGLKDVLNADEDLVGWLDKVKKQLPCHRPDSAFRTIGRPNLIRDRIYYES